jgi:Tfp pilus assembly protein PilF
LTRASEIAPGEPAAIANLGILALRQQELEAARKYMEQARALAPDNSRIEQFLGEIDSRRGNLADAIRHFRRAVELDANDPQALYALAEQVERQGTREAETEAQRLLQQLLRLQPSNTAVLLDLIRLSARTQDANTLNTSVTRLQELSASWSEEARRRLEELKQGSGRDLRAAAIQAAFLRNVLMREPSYRQDTNTVKAPAVVAGEPFVHFLRLPSPPSEPAAADEQTSFVSQPLGASATKAAVWVRAVYLDDTGKPAVLWSDSSTINLQSGAIARNISGPAAVAAADLNYDFKTDFVVASAGGVRIYRQEEPQRFSDVTSQARLPKAIVAGSYTGAWPFDVDLDGDLDVFLGASGGPPVVMRNNADGSFAIVRPFPSVTSSRDFAAADLDGDGDPDAALVDAAGRLSVWTNERLGHYRPRSVPGVVAQGVSAITAADINRDGQMDLLVLRNDAVVVQLSDRNDGREWQTSEVVKGQAGARSLITADFDNNGALDVLVGSRVFLGGVHGFTALDSTVDVNSPDIADFNGDGRLDVVGSQGGTPLVLTNHGSKAYGWQAIRTRAANAHGDQRINSFGLGGEIEVRAGLLTQKQIINSPLLHFGLGEQPRSDLARIIWPNGLIQVEFELKANQSILAAQRLKGSCPSLFAWNGSSMAFVKDGAPWSPALGLHINAQQVAGIYKTEEWFKIPGNLIAARDGYYDLRITAELWETYYIDHYSLLVVDHPPGTEIFADERFAVPPPPLKIYTTAVPGPFFKAVDDNGDDVSELVARTDGAYLDTFGRGQYQGVTRDHWIELELPAQAPQSGPLYLIADGWMHPTDATVNVALGQASAPPPQGLRIEVPDKAGRWMPVRAELGFPAGKLKTIVLDISTIFKPGTPRKLRLGTNLEVYWDRLAWAQGVEDGGIRTANLPLASAELRYRGFSVMKVADVSSPEIPDYESLEATGQKWRDLEGYYTRYGDVRPLLEKIDDRMVIVNAGDEIRLNFKASQPVPPGWQRDFIMIGDGWIKDGDYNSVFSKTVLPLPYHGLKDYTVHPSSLEEEVAYRKHPLDWEQYHTRYVAPDFFRRSLWNR